MSKDDLSSQEQAQYWCLAYRLSLPEEYEVTAFRCPRYGDLFLNYANGITRETGGDVPQAPFHPILRKKKFKHEEMATEEELKNRVSHWCQAYDISVPEEFEVIRFGYTLNSEEYWLSYTGAAQSGMNFGDPRPILRMKSADKGVIRE
jgi:hypothetical protein